MGPNYTAVLENHLHMFVEVVLLMIQATSFMLDGAPLILALLLASF
jgi:hypothetical protein